jgi:predicted extracellular nuclease
MRIHPLASLIAAAFAVPAALASPSGIVISQVYGGGGNSGATYKQDFIELFNAASVPVAIGGWSVQYASSTGTSWAVTAIPAGVTLQPGQYYLVREAQGAGGSVDVPGDASGTLALSATAGKVALVKSNIALSGANPGGAEDIVSFGSAATPTEGAPAPGLSNTTAALRAAKGCTDTNVNSADFASGAPSPRNTTSTLNACNVPVNLPIVPSCPDGATVAGMAGSFVVSAKDGDGRVNAATKIESPNAWPAGITLGSFTGATTIGDTATQSIEVADSVVAGSYALSLSWSNDQGQQASCSFKVAVQGITPIYNIQGSGAKSAMAGQTVVTTGVVTQVGGNGFFLQDPVGDGDPATSDGIFVFTSTAPTVSVGQLLRVGGTVTEFNVGSSAESAAHTMTEINGVSSITVLGSGYSIAPVEIDLATLPADGLEAFEGMLVSLRGPLTVQQTEFLGRYGQVSIAAGGRLNTPTNVLRPGPDALALLADNKRRSILLDDGTGQQNPNPTPYIGLDNTLRVGDTLPGVTGVIDVGLATSSAGGAVSYRIQPTIAPDFARTNPRVASPQVSGGNVRIASANVLNFFTTFTDGSTFDGKTGQGCSLGATVSASNCRGADSLAEFQRQRAKTVENLSALNADVLGLMEIQNNGDTTIQHLVDLLNAKMGAGTYAIVPYPAQGTGTDAIRVAMIYKPGKLTLNGVSMSDPAPINNRFPLGQSFLLPNGEKFAVIVNHLRSKGSCPASGANADDGLQGCWNQTRIDQIAELKTFMAQVQSTTGTTDMVLLGDFNAHAKEDPIDSLTSDGSVIDAVSHFDPADWSYVFDGASGRLDHGFITAGLLPKLVYATSWHINADEPSYLDYNLEFKQPACAACGPDLYSVSPYRSSDHDPMVMGLSLVKNITGTTGRDTIVGTAGDDVITGGMSGDTLSGNGGRNQFVYTSLLDAGDTITDFSPANDTLVLTQLLKSLGISSPDPLATGHVICSMYGSNAIINVDQDGSAGPLKPRAVVQLRNVNCATLGAGNYKF